MDPLTWGPGKGKAGNIDAFNLIMSSMENRLDVSDKSVEQIIETRTKLILTRTILLHQ